MKNLSMHHSDISQLISIIEHHESTKSRIEALSRLEKVRYPNDQVFRLLENLIVSDEEDTVKAKAAEFLSKHYLVHGKELIKWIFEHETAAIVFKSILEALKEIAPQYCVELDQQLLEKYIDIHHLVSEECVFFRDLDFLLSERFKEIKLDWPTRRSWTPEDKESVKRDFQEGFKFFEINAHVRILNLNGLQINKIPESIGNLCKLTDLRLHDNNLESLPNNMENLKRLKKLDLRNNYFRDIPEVILKLKKLTDLNLGGNRIGLGSKNMVTFIRTKLIRKYLNENIDKDNAETLGFIELIKGSAPLKTDNLEHPFVYDFFGEGKEYRWFYNIDKYGHITELAVCEADISFLLDRICNFSHLEELYLYDCNIERIPKSIRKLKSLKKLFLDKNKIKKIPSSMKSLRFLEDLSFYRNKIKKMPKFLKDMENIQYYNFSRNPISNTSIPLDFLKDETDSN